MKVNPHIFRAYDIRGIADPIDKNKPADLTEETVYLIAKATATYLKNKHQAQTIAVGTDCRLTAEPLKKAYIKGLTEMGMKVTDIGLCTSPMLYWTVCALNFDAGTAITASHNPKEYNGLKIVSKNAHSICGPELQEVLAIINNESYLENQTPGTVETMKVWPKYLEDLKSKVKIGKKLKIVVDSGNGAAGPFAPELLEALGCEVISLYCKPDGNFPNHEANPEELKNMLELIEAVKENQADFGMGFDGDGDRIGIVNEKGELYSADYLILLLARDLVTRQKGAKVVFDVKVSQVIIDELSAIGATPVMCKTGHSFIEQKMKEINAPLAGEVSGHLFFNENYFGFDDAFLAAAKIIEILSNSDKPISEHFTNLRKVYNTPEIKVPCPDDKKFPVVKALVEHFTALYPSTTIDGVRVNFTKSSWGAVRASNTSPNLTLRFEADTEEQLEKIQTEMYSEMKKQGITVSI